MKTKKEQDKKKMYISLGEFKATNFPELVKNEDLVKQYKAECRRNFWYRLLK